MIDKLIQDTEKTIQALVPGTQIKVVRPRECSENEKDRLITALHDVAIDSFGRWLPREAIDGRSREAEYVITVIHDNELIAYGVNELLDVDGMRINCYGSGFVRRAYQGIGLGTHMFNLRWDMCPAPYLVTRTQNPLVYKELSKLCRNKSMTLHPNQGSADDDILRIARAYDPSTSDEMISRKVYFGRELMDRTPDPGSARWLWEKINVKEGDAIVFVARGMR
jgi:hypothetical protein